MTGISKTRETWLQDAVELIAPIFTSRGYKIPRVEVSCGFPSTGSRSRHIGQCWGSKTSDAQVNQIFISPTLDDPVDVLDTLTHELVHAVDDCEHRHGPEFKKIALDVGLEGKMREAGAGAKLKEEFKDFSRKLGKYPHTKLNIAHRVSSSAPRPRAKCKKCGYEVTPLKKWRHMGPPICPKDHVEMEAIGSWEED